MSDVIQFALLGLGLGTLYTLASQGLILIYRGSGVLNFAQGALGMVGGYLSWDLMTNAGFSFVPAFVVGVLATAALGAITHLGIMRPLRRASMLARTVATLGVLTTLQAIVVLRYGTGVTVVPSTLPQDPIQLGGGVTISLDRIVLLGIAVVVTAGLFVLYRYTLFGLSTSAVAENQRAAAALGWSPDVIATINWALGTGLSGAAAILISPIIQLQSNTMTTLVLAAMAAALVAKFRSFPIALGTSLAIAVVQTELQRYVPVVGLSDSVPFIVIIVILVSTGRVLPLRDFLFSRLPKAGSGRVRPITAAIAFIVGVVVILLVPGDWQSAIAVTLGAALILLSIVVITGYAGQLSLAQYAVAGLSAYFSAEFVSTFHWPFLAAVAVAVLATAAAGFIMAIPALRTRGIYLAVTTLGIGTAIQLMLFNNGPATGGLGGIHVPPPRIFGLSIDPIVQPGRYAIFALVCFVLAALAVAAIRRGPTGRRLLAVRTNERAAAAMGISLVGSKVYAFVLGSAIAALGGVVMAFANSSIIFTSFTSFLSISFVGFAFVGGIGFVLGPLVGGTLASGSVGSQLLQTIVPDFTAWLPLVGGAMVLLVVLTNQDGSAAATADQFQAVARWASRRRGGARREHVTVLPGLGETRSRVPAKTLTVDGLVVRYGGTTAVNGLSLKVEPGKIVGLIGPNGAGKTSAIDAISGFTRPASGSVSFDGAILNGLSAADRSHHGLSRSFQSLELFEDMTVIENLRTAADPRTNTSYLRDLVWPSRPPLPDELIMAVKEFQLEDSLDVSAENLPYARRRSLAIARAISSRPSVLLLDEPAAGLGTVESMELARLVRRLADEWGMGILLVEHDMSFVMSICDSITVLDFGRQIAQGDPESIRTDPAVIEAYLGTAEVADAVGAGARTAVVSTLEAR